jgi:hypothetical protein
MIESAEHIARRRAHSSEVVIAKFRVPAACAEEAPEHWKQGTSRAKR